MVTGVLNMEFWGKIITFFDSQMQEPTNYGWFHIMFIAIALCATVLLCVFLRDAKDRTFRIIIFSCWALMVLLEIYKQLNYGFTYNEELNTITWDYQWYAFPFQFCSTPLYVLPFIAFLPKGHVRDAMMAFMAFFSLFGGLGVFAYPNDVFIGTIGINIQTMIHHGLQVVLGIYIAVYTRKKFGIMYYVKAAIVFVALMAIAVIMNISVYHMLTAAGINETFNMFYIGPYYPSTLPVLSGIYPSVHPVLFIFIYLFGFLAIGMLIFGITYGIISLVHLIKKAVGKSCKA